jgi:CubicO group peptidase (beta-lactamase class C family)
MFFRCQNAFWHDGKHIANSFVLKKAMLKKTLTICLLTIFLLAFPVIKSVGQTVSQNISSVENGLIPYVPVSGFPPWNIYQRMKYYNVKGVSIAVIKDFKIEWAKGYGMADTLKKTPVTTNTMFSAGSISKLLAAAIAMKLVQDGRLALDSPINNYLQSWQITDNEFTQKTPVTLRMLLSHTAGTSQSSYFGLLPDKYPLPTIVEILNGAPIAESRRVVVNSAPGKEFRYSGGGSMIAQMAMMDVAKTPFEVLASKVLFNPMGIKNATFAQPLPVKYSNQASWGYSAASWYKGMPYVYPQQAAAGLYATPTELAKFIIELQKCLQGKGSLLAQPLAKQMTTPQAEVSMGSYHEQIGVGPFLLERADNKEEKGRYLEFTGVNAGFTAYVIGNLVEGYGSVIMLNSGDDNNGLGMELRRAIANTYNWYHFLPEPVTPIKISADNAQQYIGRYRKGADEVVTISSEKGYFIERINNGSVIYCFPVAKDTVVLTDFNVKAVFKRDSNNQIVGLQTAYQDKPMPKMLAGEYTPGELLGMKKYSAAAEAYGKLQLNEYQLTYMIYDLLHKPGADEAAIFTLLQLAQNSFPSSSIVFSRWGDYYLKQNNRVEAISNYKKALALSPDDKELTEKVAALQTIK